MIKYFTITFLFLLSFGIQAQSLRIVDTESNVTGEIGTDLKATVKIQNISDKPVRLKIQKLDNKIESGQVSYFCLGGNCVDGITDEINSQLIIQPGEIVQEFVSILEPGLRESASSITYRFINADDPTDATNFSLNYLVESENSKGILFYNNKIRVSNLYPNPVDKIAIVDYDLDLDEESTAKIIFQNVLGSIINEYELQQFENKIKISTESLNPGVYFYTLQVDNQNLVTKKFIIKR